jgi:hypothetical protein
MAGINEYILGREIASLPEDSVVEFRDPQYDLFNREYGIKRLFSDEIFYAATNRIFLDRECIHTIISTLEGKIYKVMFRYITPNEDEYESFRADAIQEMYDRHGQPSKKKQVDAFRSITIWDGSFGNVIVDADMLGTSVIYTSSQLRKRPFYWLWKLIAKK